MRFLVWLLRVLVFIALFGLAIKNSGLVDLRMYFNTVWQTPLAIVVLGSFALGALLGVTAGLSTLIRQRRTIGQLQAQLRRQDDLRTPLQMQQMQQTQVQDAV